MTFSKSLILNLYDILNTDVKIDLRRNNNRNYKKLLSL